MKLLQFLKYVAISYTFYYFYVFWVANKKTQREKEITKMMMSESIERKFINNLFYI